MAPRLAPSLANAQLDRRAQPWFDPRWSSHQCASRWRDRRQRRLAETQQCSTRRPSAPPELNRCLDSPPRTREFQGDTRQIRRGHRLRTLVALPQFPVGFQHAQSPEAR